MSSVLVDSNILLDIFYNDPNWFSWSEKAFMELAESHSFVINPIIYAEVSVGFSTIEQLEEVLPKSEFKREPLPLEAGFLAGKAFKHYRKKGGTKTSTMPDFYIGAHAAVKDMVLLTRDKNRYATYFPGVELYSP